MDLFQSQIRILPRHSSGLLLGIVLGLPLHMCLSLLKAQIWGPSPHTAGVPPGHAWMPTPCCMLAPGWPWAVLRGPAALLGLTVLLQLPLPPHLPQPRSPLCALCVSKALLYYSREFRSTSETQLCFCSKPLPTNLASNTKSCFFLIKNTHKLQGFHMTLFQMHLWPKQLHAGCSAAMHGVLRVRWGLH